MNNILILCIIVFFARIIDTSLSTIRTVLVIKDNKTLAVIIAFIEIFVWFLVVREALNSIDNALLIAIAYSAGYATGVLVGMILTEKLITTNISVNIVVKEKKEIVSELINNNFAVSVSRVKGKDLKSNKYMIFVATTSKRLSTLKRVVTHIDEHAFIVVSENKMVVNGYK